MKALVCRDCMDIRALPDLAWLAVVCRCESSCAWWEDPRAGVAHFAGRAPWPNERLPHPGAPSVFFLGLHNAMLRGALLGQASLVDDADYRALHDAATDADGYHFDKTRKACWAILLRPGMSSDTRVVTAAPAGLINRPGWLPVAEP